MAANVQTIRHIPLLAEFESRDRKALEQALAKYDARVRATADELSLRADKVEAQLRRRLERMAGVPVRKSTAAKLSGRPPRWRGPAMNRRRVAGLLNANVEAMTDVVASTRPLPELHLPPGFELPPPDPNDPHRWFRHEPPFWGFLMDVWNWCKGGFRADYELHLKPSTGLVGARVNLSCDDADFGGLGQARADSQIAFAITPPATGVLEVVVDAMSLRSRVDVDITDNWWFSHAHANLYNYMTLTVLHPSGPEEQLQLMDESAVHSDGDNVSAHHSHLNLVQHYFSHFFTAQPVPANRPLILAVGNRNMDITSATNMTVRSQTDYQWFLNQVSVRVVP